MREKEKVNRKSDRREKGITSRGSNIHTLEHFIKYCSPWEGITLEKFIESCILSPVRQLSPVSHTGAGDNSQEQGEAETMCNKLTPVPISCHSVLLGEGDRELEITLHWEEGKSWESYS